MDPSPGALRIETGAADGRFQLILAGDLDVASAHRPYEAVVAAFEADPDVRDVVLDMTAVTFLDSTGIGTLVRIWQSAAERGGTLTLVGLAPRYRKLLAMTGLDGDLRLADS